jgi:hypothetical protein
VILLALPAGAVDALTAENADVIRDLALFAGVQHVGLGELRGSALR